MLPLTCIPRPRPGFRLEIMGDELLLFHPAQAKVYYCNPTASLIWRLCDGQRSLGVILDLLREAYPEAGAVVEPDVVETLEALRGHGALDWE